MKGRDVDSNTNLPLFDNDCIGVLLQLNAQVSRIYVSAFVAIIYPNILGKLFRSDDSSYRTSARIIPLPGIIHYEKFRRSTYVLRYGLLYSLHVCRTKYTNIKCWLYRIACVHIV